MLGPLEVAHWLFLLGVALMTMLFGMVLEGLPAAVVLIPVVFPIATRMGINPIHFDIVQTAAVGIGLFLPPMGVGLLMALRFAEVSVAQHAPCLLALCPGIADRAVADHLPARAVADDPAQRRFCSITRGAGAMDLRFTADELAFRDELRAFFRDNLPGDIRERMRLGHAPSKEDTVTWQRILNSAAGPPIAGQRNMAARAGHRCSA